MSAVVHEPGGRDRRLPVAPLVALIVDRGGFAACAGRLDDLERVRLDRALHRGIRAGQLTWAAADQLSVRLLGVHPMMVWGEDWLRPD